MNAYLAHFGCRLNLYESQSIAAGLAHNKLKIVDDLNEADLIIVNTCTVTNRADQKDRQIIRKAHRLNPSAKIIVTGCYATTDTEEVKALPGVYSVVTNQNKATIPDLVSRISSHDTAKHRYVKNLPAKVDGRFGYHYRTRKGHSRAYLKIQDGCNKTCAYCKIPQARGRGISRNFNDSLTEAQHLIDIGFKEIILTGVNIGWYRSQEGFDLYRLLEEILNLEGEFYIRLSSIEPRDVNERLADLFTHHKMAKFLHVPLQSGSKKILKCMRRGYNPSLYEKRVNAVRNTCSKIHLGTDIIVGFPGESEKDFRETLDFCRKMEFSNIHIFPFSERRNTPVMEHLKSNSKNDRRNNGDLWERVPGRTIRDRIHRLQVLKEKLMKQFIQRTSGLDFRAVIEKIGGDGDDLIYSMVTENYVKLNFRSSCQCLSKGEMVYARYDDQGGVISFQDNNSYSAYRTRVGNVVTSED